MCRVNGSRFGRGASGVFLSQVKLVSHDVLRLGTKKKDKTGDEEKEKQPP